jgi:hypothetical protein
MKQNHYIDGIKINDPINHAQLTIDLNYNDDSITELVSVNQWEIGVSDNRFSNDGYRLLNDYIQKGLSGGNGVTEGINYQIYIDNEKGTSYNIFNGYLDLWRAKIEPDKITATSTEQGKLDWLNQVADSVTFEYLFSIGEITTADFIAIPYIINRRDNGLEIALTSLSLFYLIQSIKKIIQDIILTIADFNVIYVSSIVRVILQLIQLVTYAIAAISLAVQIFQQLLPPVKFHYGMYVSDLLRIGLNHFGLKFSSSILEQGEFKDLFILPEKYNIITNVGKFAGVTGILQTDNFDKKGFFNGTVGQLLRQTKDLFRAKILIDSGTLYLENQAFRLPKPIYKLPKVEQAKTNGYSFNSEDFSSNLLLTFITDRDDRNTVQDYLGTSVQVITTPKVIGERGRVITRNYKEINFGFALGKPKTELSFIEKLAEDFNKGMIAVITGIEAVISTIEKIMAAIVKASNKIIKALKVVGINIKIKFMPSSVPKGISTALNNLKIKLDASRIGMLMMECDYVMIPKLLLVPRKNTAKQRIIQVGNLSARYLHDNFYIYDSFVPNADNIHNQYILKSVSKIDFTFEDYEKARLSNHITDDQGNEARLISLKWNPIEGYADIEYKVNQIYTLNLQQSIIEPDGK